MRMIPIVVLLALCGCDGDPPPACRAIDKCTTPACTQFPTTPGCTFAVPINGRCPLDHPQCFDPTRAAGYCNPQGAVCAKPRTPLPATCPTRLCNSGDVAVCNEVGSGLFCQGEYRCVAFQCDDGGVSDAGVDAGVDAGADAAVTDAAVTDAAVDAARSDGSARDLATPRG